MATAIDAKGDLIGGTGADAFDRLAVGADGTQVADSTEATGLKWATLDKVLKVAFSFNDCCNTSMNRRKQLQQHIKFSNKMLMNRRVLTHCFTQMQVMAAYCWLIVFYSLN
jgi:hypothetical protein